MNAPKPILTREHGAWAVLFVPMAVGASAAGIFSLNVLFLAVSALGVFMSYVPVHTLLREVLGTRQEEEKVKASFFWAPADVGVGILFLIPLLAKGYWQLLWIGAIGVTSFFGNFFLTRNFQKTVLSDLVAVFGLTLSAPSAYYVTTGMINETAFTLWILNFLFFGCSVFYVHMKMHASSLKKMELSFDEKLSVGKLNVLYHLVVIAIVALLTMQHSTPQLAVVAFVPMTVHALYGTAKLSSRVRFKNLGLLLLGQSVVFGLVMSLAR